MTAAAETSRSWRDGLALAAVWLLFVLCLPFWCAGFLARAIVEWTLAGWAAADRLG